MREPASQISGAEGSKREQQAQRPWHRQHSPGQRNRTEAGLGGLGGRRRSLLAEEVREDAGGQIREKAERACFNSEI